MRLDVGARYRWLTVGARARYVGRAGRAGLHGREGVVVAVPRYGGDGPKNAAVLLDGDTAALVAPAGCYRALGTPARDRGTMNPDLAAGHQPSPASGARERS